MVSPVEFKKERDTAEVQNNISPRENGHGFSDTFTNSVGSSISMPRIDSHILGKETLEQREKFTLYKIEVNNGQKSWIIYRRYGDFVLLNKKLRRLFPEFRLHCQGNVSSKITLMKALLTNAKEVLKFLRTIYLAIEISSSVIQFRDSTD